MGRSPRIRSTFIRLIFSCSTFGGWPRFLRSLNVSHPVEDGFVMYVKGESVFLRATAMTHPRIDPDWPSEHVLPQSTSDAACAAGTV